MIKVFKYKNGSTARVDTLDPAWLQPDSKSWVWVDLDQPTPDEARILTDVFHFHELAVEDALAELHHPKIESYGGYLYLILHGIDFRAKEHEFRTQDVDFFVGERYLVTVHPGVSRSIGRDRPDLHPQRPDAWRRAGLSDAPHRRRDGRQLPPGGGQAPGAARSAREGSVRGVAAPAGAPHHRLERDVSSLRRVVQPQRDVVGRLARREFPLISEPLAYRFRDVYDHLVRLTDESMFFGDRITSLLDAHLSTVSNQLNSVMKILTVIATIFMPLTFITGLYGMNVDLPHFGLGATRFFWVLLSFMLAISGGMLAFFRVRRWI